MSQKFHDHFSGVANRYADFRPHYPAALFDYFATLVPHNATVWDCAAGNGQATHDLAKRFDKVIATDASKEQIASTTPNPKVEFRVASAEQSGLPDDSVELITVAQALHWFDFERFYNEARRVLKSDGVLAAWAYGINTVEGAEVNQLVQDFLCERRRAVLAAGTEIRGGGLSHDSISVHGDCRAGIPHGNALDAGTVARLLQHVVGDESLHQSDGAQSTGVAVGRTGARLG